MSPLRLARKKRNLSQEELGNRVGVRGSQIHRLETKGVDIDTALLVLEELKPDVTLFDLIKPLDPKEAKRRRKLRKKAA